jgi:hypothetical protein
LEESVTYDRGFQTGVFPWGVLLVLWGRVALVVLVRDIFILKEI